MGCNGSKNEPPKTKQFLSKPIKPRQNKKINECKIVLLGDKFVGKSSISQRLCNDCFYENYDGTIGGAYLQYQITLKNGETLKLHIWDTGGEGLQFILIFKIFLNKKSERFRAMAPLYYRDAQGAVLVYDIGDPSTFTSINYWIGELDTLVKQEGMVLALAGNKCDIAQNLKLVSTDQARQYKTSAKSGEGIKILFQKLAEEIGKKLNIIPQIQQ